MLWRNNLLLIFLVLTSCSSLFADPDSLNTKAPSDSVATDTTAQAVTAPDTLPPIVNPAPSAPFDPRANMVHVLGRDVTWQSAGNEIRKCGSFYIDRTEVTNRDFAYFLSANDSNARFYDSRMDIVNSSPKLYLAKSGKENYPVAYVDWLGAYAFAKWAGKNLPTEEEWIVAALDNRPATSLDALYPWGNTPPDSTRGNFFATAGFPGRVAVSNYPSGATSGNVADLLGNVAEWTVTEAASNLPSGSSHSWMVVKGGSFLDPPSHLTIAGKALRDRAERLGSLGFRCIIRDQPAK